MDHREAVVLSWAAGKYMKAMIAPDADSYRTLPENGQATFNAGAMATYRKEAANMAPRCRSEEEKLQGSLPLQLPIRLEPGSVWPKHAVNMIELPTKLEHHRDKLFWQMFKTLIVVPTRDEAIQFQQACADQGKRCPSIVCLDGHRVESSSFSDPEASLKPGSAVPFVFGTLAPSQTREWQAADRAEESCNELLCLLNNKVQLRQQMQSTQHELE